jgi:predicted DNA-binding transcriptional regulator AlpA
MTEARRLLGVEDVMARTGLGLSSAYELMKRLPFTVYLGAGKRKMIRALASSLEEFIARGGDVRAKDAERLARHPRFQAAQEAVYCCHDGHGHRSLSAPGAVYFVQGEAGTPIKIGYTKHSVERRLKDLQTGAAFELRVLAQTPGCVSLERDLHQIYQRIQTHREWFAPAEDLLALCDYLGMQEIRADVTHEDMRAAIDLLPSFKDQP